MTRLNPANCLQLLDESALNARYGEKTGEAEVSKAQRKGLVQGVSRGDETSDRLDKAYTMAQTTTRAGDEILNKLHGRD